MSGHAGDDDPSAETGTAARLLAVRSKLRARGPGWLAARLAEELRTPSTRPGLWLRTVNAAALNVGARVFAAPVRLFTAPGRTLYLFYDLEVSPITFDFCFALAGAELERRRLDLDRIRVVVVPGRLDGLRRERADYEEKVDKANRRWRVHNILIPLCRLVPTVEGVTLAASRGEASALRALFARRVWPTGYWPVLPVAHRPNDVLDAARAGRIVRPFQATERARTHVAKWIASRVGDGKRIVSVTLRSYDYMPARNSDIVAWTTFAREIAEEGFHPVFVPDTDAAFDPPPRELEGLTVFGEAAWNLELRMALFEASWLNMMINNGPFGPAAFSRVRYLMFKILTPSAIMTTAAYMRTLGYDLNRTPQFAAPFQKWVWEDDALETIRREFQAMRRLIEEAEVAGAGTPRRRDGTFA